MSIEGIQRTVSTRLPTAEGQFQLVHYHNDQDEKEHLALVMGDVAQQSEVLVRVHSECFTGDVLGSQRCDCGEQLHAAMQMIAAEGRGVVIYLRQEGRGIGLQKKLQAYNLQDQGYDTVDANLLLGHQADERTYDMAVGILRDLQIRSLRLLTNNPNKIDQLQEYGLTITARVPLVATVNAENVTYLTTKVQRMRHLLYLPTNGQAPANNVLPSWTLPTPVVDAKLPLIANNVASELRQAAHQFFAEQRLPFVTISYAQSIDGTIAAASGAPLAISGETSLAFTHLLRASHDAILVGVGTVLADNPRLTVRLVEGVQPQPIILDSKLRTPSDARCLIGPRPAWVATTAVDFAQRAAIETMGGRVFHLPADEQGQVDLWALLQMVAANGIRSIMVEGGATVINSFLQQRLANNAVVTIAPRFIGGLHVLANKATGGVSTSLRNPNSFQLGEDLILHGQLTHRSQGLP